MKKIQIDKSRSTKDIADRIRDLFPIHRTLVNDGYRISMDRLKQELPFVVHEIPSGKQVLDWIVPKSWNVKVARIKDPEGNTLIDFADHNLHLSAYSREFNGIISHEELLSHLNFREDLPEAIPYNFHYYKSHWSFNLSFDTFREKFIHDGYEVEMKINEYDDFLRIGEIYLPGEREEEVLITSYMCHPSMVNDNLSGVVVTTELFKYLQQVKGLKYSYRLIIIPETIGAIAYLAEFPEKCEKVFAGLTAYCCGGNGKLHYKKTYSGETMIDEVAKYSFDQFYPDVSVILPFWPGGSDERQFNGTGVRMPMGALTRIPPAEFKEYHTSLDTPELISPESLVDTLENLATMINVLEADNLYVNHYKAEPCFSRHDIAYPTFRDALAKSAAYIVKILANEVDGSNSLLDIAVKWNMNIFDLAEMARAFEKEGLISVTR
ncbi:MAG: DUF4910 domain-containing protein [Saprospiraceae bacterium]|nr:DUF4910 domain-containing protein [Lewinella sp.]